MIRTIAISAILLAAAAPLCGADPAVRAWQSTLILPTWEEGAPDPIPHFSVLEAGTSWYPYPVRTHFGTVRRNEVWRALNLENEYLACIILPDLGGHLYGCRDKLSGYEMFHANPSIKKANIALRGARAALGVELNFPEGHSLVTVSPVDFRMTQSPGSASVWVGATDRVTGMRWRVEFALEQGSAALRQSVRLENATPSTHRYQWWTNAGVTLRDGTRFVLPAGQVPDHGFLAVFHTGSRTGTVHYADPTEMPGKKIWAWGQDQDRAIRQMLSDDNSQYVEIQAGLFANQETFGDLEPGQSRSFTEYWLPVRGIDGISRVTRDAVIYAGRDTVQILPLRKADRVALRVGSATEVVALDPARPLTRPLGEVTIETGRPSLPAKEQSIDRMGLIREAALARNHQDRAKADAAIARAAAIDPTDPLARFEQFRQGARDPDLWTHLAGDPERVLEIADRYVQWGLCGDALIALARMYPPVPRNQMEPGAPAPQDHALLVYYRGYCNRLLGRYANEDFRLAGSLPVTYVFPHLPESKDVLTAALEMNADDASAHYLLGLWYLHAGSKEEGARELQQANRLRPGLAEARALLAAMKLPVVAPPPPPKTSAAPPPVEPAKARQQALLPPPAAPAGTPHETAVMALESAAAGTAARALGYFTATNFPQEKQDDFVRQAYIEIQLQRLLELAEARQCAEVDRLLPNLGEENRNLPFTFHGFENLMKGARFQYLLGVVEFRCADERAARKRWEKVSRLRPDPASPDFAYPQAALAALQRPLDLSAVPATGTDDYTRGILLALQGKSQEAAERFRAGAAAAPPGLLRYLNQDALRNGIRR